MEWKFFDHVLPNTVYGLHDYSMMGFPKGQKYIGTTEQNSTLESQFLRKASFMSEHGTPIWNGEFGPVYSNPTLEPDTHAETNTARINLLSAQLDLYAKHQIHWSIWLYKDIGLQGMVHLDPSSPYMTRIAPFLAKKQALQLDAWGRSPSPQIENLIAPLVEFIDRNCPTSKDQYPTPWATERQITRLVNQIWMSGCLSDEFAEQFRGMSLEELEMCARSFRFEECVQRKELNEVLERHAREEVDEGKHAGRANGQLSGKEVRLESD